MTSSFQRRIGHADIHIETGKLALQANGAVVVRRGDSMVLVTATMDKPREGIDFFPSDRGLRGEALRQGAHTRRLSQEGGPAQHRGDTDQPAHRQALCARSFPRASATTSR